jgi:hypothetical protein
MLNRCLLFVAVVTIGVSPLMAGGTTFIEDFESGTNVGAWSYGPPPSIPDSGGNPGAYLDSGLIDTFAPRLRTNQVETVFTGDYRAADVTGIGVDLNTFNAQTTAGRPLAAMLIHDPGTPGDPSDDTAAYTFGANIPAVGAGWVSYDFDVPSQETELPAGWFLLNVGDIGLPAVGTWDEVIQDVDRLQYHYGDPTLFFIFQQWNLGADNLRISSGGGSGDGGDGGADVPASSPLGMTVLVLLLVLSLGAMRLRNRGTA